MKIEFSRQIFEKILGYEISWKFVEWKPRYFMLAEARTDMTKLIIAFRDFANRSKNSTFCPHSVFMCFVWIWEQTLTDWFLEQKFNPLKPSGHYMYRQFNIQQFYVLPTQCIYVFCLDLRKKTAIISLYNINWLVFRTEI